MRSKAFSSFTPPRFLAICLGGCLCLAGTHRRSVSGYDRSHVSVSAFWVIGIATLFDLSRRAKWGDDSGNAPLAAFAITILSITRHMPLDQST